MLPRPRLALAALALLAAAALAGCDPSASSDVAEPGPAASTEWFATLRGADGADQVNAVAELPDGDVVVVGYAIGPSAVAGPTGEPVALTGATVDGNGFAARLGPTGAVRWARPLATGSGFGTVIDVAAVPGGVVVSGRFSGTVTLGATTATAAGSLGGFVARLGDDGAVAWVRIVESPVEASASELAADAAGAVTVGGTYRTSVTVAGQTRPSAGGTDAWVARLAPDGALTWLTGYGGAGGESFNAAAVGPAGEAYVGGSFSGTLAVGGEAFASAGGRDGLALRLGPDGRVVWARHLAGAGPDDYVSGAGASAGGVGFAGLASSAVTIGGQTTPGGGMFAVGVTPEGSVRWLTSDADAGACSAAMDAAGGLIVGGGYLRAGAFGSATGRRFGGGGTDGYVARFTPAGAVDWVRTQNGPDDERTCLVAAGAAHAYATGWYGFEATLDGAAWPVASLNALDGFVARFRLAPADS